MKNILLINGGKKFAHSEGRLSNTLHNVAKDTLLELGYNIEETIIDSGYDINTEIEKILKADVLIYQLPAWWMSVPWTVKKYIDEVYTEGHGKFYTSDGRTRSDDSKKYGSGGLLHNKKVMLSVTWNAPINAFEDVDNFFEGVGVEGVYSHFYKIHQFMGMSKLPIYICNDVIKNPTIDIYIENYKKHLTNIFKK